MRVFSLLALLAASLAPTAFASSHFADCQAMTGRSATLIIPADAFSSSALTIEPGSEVALFTPDDTCAGHAVWEGGALALAVWEDDPQTSARDGFVAGDEVRLAIWNPATALEYEAVPAEFDSTFTPSPVFASDAVYLVSVLGRGGDDEGGVSTPVAFGLEPTYPNPFVDATHIRYAIAETAEVQLDVYNLLGQRVVRLVDDVREPGRYEITFRPDANLASGTYIYRLTTDAYSESHRMTLLR